MSSIATKRGDGGETSLLGGKRVSKTDQRVCAYGAVDELSATIGLCRAHAYKEDVRDRLLKIQSELVTLMGELATEATDHAKYLEKTKGSICRAHVVTLDLDIQRIEQAKGGFKGWQLSGETLAQAFFDLARTTCRRAEREIVALQLSGEEVRSEILQYMNRLSDLLWLYGREHG